MKTIYVLPYNIVPFYIWEQLDLKIDNIQEVETDNYSFKLFNSEYFFEALDPYYYDSDYNTLVVKSYVYNGYNLLNESDLNIIIDVIQNSKDGELIECVRRGLKSNPFISDNEYIGKLRNELFPEDAI